MFLAQRLEKIKQLLYEHKTLDVVTLSNNLEVSEVTIRKDLDKLEKMGFLKKYRGGAILEEDTLSGLKESAIAGFKMKEECIEPAIQIVSENDKIYISSGTTCSLFAKKLKIRSINNLNVITNNFEIVRELYETVNSMVFLGGEVQNRNSMLFTVNGGLGDCLLKNQFFNKAFISVDGIDVKAGYTVTDSREAELLRFIRTVTDKVVIIADSTKFGKISMHKIEDLSFADYIATDKGITDDYKGWLFERNIKILAEFSL